MHEDVAAVIARDEVEALVSRCTTDLPVGTEILVLLDPLTRLSG